MKEGEYLKRLSACLMNHYKNHMEIHIFTDIRQVEGMDMGSFHGVLLGDYDPTLPEMAGIPKEKILYLKDTEEESKEDTLFHVLSKYEEIPRIVDILGILAGTRECNLSGEGKRPTKENLFGVYSLSEVNLQLPFLMTLANIMAEKYKVLVVDLQENSGLFAEEEQPGMEEAMAMAKTGKYTRGRLIASVGHYQQWDYIYPVKNSECLCEGDYELYQSLIHMMEKEMNYDAVIINFGTRFQGFFRLISDCKVCFLLGEENKKSWREQSFYEEVEKTGNKELKNTFIKMNMAYNQQSSLSVQNLTEQWTRSDSGELLRKIIYRERYRG